MKVPCALTIAGSDSGSGAGIQADLKTFSSLGVHGLCVLTAATAQNTKCVDVIFELPPDFVRQQLDTVMRDFEVKWAKTGMLGNAATIKAVRDGIRRYNLRAVVDPVMVAATGARLLREDAFDSMVELISSAEIVTPNVIEAELLSGLKIRSNQHMKKAAMKIAELGPKSVVVKGGHLKGQKIIDVLYLNKRFIEFKSQRVSSGPTHGTGCSFSAAITAELAKGADILEAIRKARDFVARAIEFKLNIGKGVKPVNQIASLLIDAEKGRAMEQVWVAAKMLTTEPKFVHILPEVGTNIVMALPGATKIQDVIGLSGRIIKVGGHPYLSGFPTLGGSKHVANIVLTAMHHDARIRAAMNIRFSHEILRSCKKSRLEIGSFDRSKEPKGTKTMKWGTEQAIMKLGKVPQVIFDRGALGKEAMIRLLGASPIELAEFALRIAKNL